MRQQGWTEAATPTSPRSRWVGMLGTIFGAFLVSSLVACGAGVAPTNAPTSAPTQTAVQVATVQPSGTTQTRATLTVPRTASPAATVTRGKMDYPDVVRAALSQAAAELGVTPEQLTIITVEARDWPDSSLGCPQPGRAYSQIVTPGYRVVVQASGRDYEYHTNQTRMIVRCTP